MALRKTKPAGMENRENQSGRRKGVEGALAEEEPAIQGVVKQRAGGGKQQQQQPRRSQPQVFVRE
jgi:hypothetical protein